MNNDIYNAGIRLRQKDLMSAIQLAKILELCDSDHKRNEFIAGIVAALEQYPTDDFDLLGLDFTLPEWEVLLKTKHHSVQRASTISRTDARSAAYLVREDDIRFDEAVTRTPFIVSLTDYASDVVVIQHGSVEDEVVIMSTNKKVRFDKHSACCLNTHRPPLSVEMMVCKKYELHRTLELIAEEYALTVK